MTSDVLRCAQCNDVMIGKLVYVDGMWMPSLKVSKFKCVFELSVCARIYTQCVHGRPTFNDSGDGEHRCECSLADRSSVILTGDALLDGNMVAAVNNNMTNITHPTRQFAKYRQQLSRDLFGSETYIRDISSKQKVQVAHAYERCCCR
jgi:hypothetical protein